MRNSTVIRGGQPDQQTLLAGFQSNDETILKKVYARVYPKVKMYVIQNNGDVAQAKDLFQEAFIAVWKNIKDHTFESEKGGGVEAYLYTIAKNKWTDYLRSAKYRKTIRTSKVISFNGSQEDIPLNTEELEEERELKQRNSMNRAFQRLGENCRSLLTQFYFENKSMEDIALKLNVGAASARNQKYRCMQKLRSLALETHRNEQ